MINNEDFSIQNNIIKVEKAIEASKVLGEVIKETDEILSLKYSMMTITKLMLIVKTSKSVMTSEPCIGEYWEVENGSS